MGKKIKIKRLFLYHTSNSFNLFLLILYKN